MPNHPDSPADAYLQAATDLARQRSFEPEAVRALRRRAAAAFEARGLPSRRDEGWRQTELKAVTSRAFPPPTAPASLARHDFRAHLLPGALTLVFVNGRFAPEATDLNGLPDGVMLTSLSEALAQAPDRILFHLGRSAPIEDHPFAALNTALMTDGAVVLVPAGARLQTPVQLLHLGTGSDAIPGIFTRNLVVAEPDSEVSLVEHYVGMGDATYFTCAITEIAVGAGAKVDCHRMQQESPSSSHIGVLGLELSDGCRLSHNSLSLGGRFARADTSALLEGEGISCVLNGLYSGAGRQFLESNVTVRHMRPHCESSELFKGILDGESRAVFTGRIYVHPGAQKTDAVQSNRNLLLSPSAVVSSNPQLEILADDVRCTHGSTVGQMDEDALFYLRARGIDSEVAEAMLIYAFAADIIDRIGIASVRHRLEQILAGRLPRGDDALRSRLPAPATTEADEGSPTR